MPTRKRVIIVDDDADMRDLMKEIFTDAGYEILTVADGNQALRCMHEDAIWALFIDLKMPVMHGTELCKKIRDEWPMAIPYAVTGCSSIFDLCKCREAGFEDYFLKPFNGKLIVDAAEKAFMKLNRWINRI